MQKNAIEEAAECKAEHGRCKPMRLEVHLWPSVCGVGKIFLHARFQSRMDVFSGPVVRPGTFLSEDPGITVANITNAASKNALAERCMGCTSLGDPLACRTRA